MTYVTLMFLWASTGVPLTQPTKALSCKEALKSLQCEERGEGRGVVWWQVSREGQVVRGQGRGWGWPGSSTC